jgi:hypothetical protein
MINELENIFNNLSSEQEKYCATWFERVTSLTEILNVIVLKLWGQEHTVIEGRATAVISFCYLDFAEKYSLFVPEYYNFLKKLIPIVLEELDKQYPTKMLTFFNSPLTNVKIFEKLLMLKMKYPAAYHWWADLEIGRLKLLDCSIAKRIGAPQNETIPGNGITDEIDWIIGMLTNGTSKEELKEYYKNFLPKYKLFHEYNYPHKGENRTLHFSKEEILIVKRPLVIASLITDMAEAVSEQLQAQTRADEIIKKYHVTVLVSFAAYVTLRMKWGEDSYRLVFEYLKSVANEMQKVSDPLSIKKWDVQYEMEITFQRYNDLFRQGGDFCTAIERDFANKVVSSGDVDTTDIFKSMTLFMCQAVL